MSKSSSVFQHPCATLSRTMTKHALLKAVRLTHLYFGVFIAPALLFFAFTGFLQTFSLHETTRGSSYKPPAIFVKLGNIHKKATLPGPPKPQGPPKAQRSPRPRRPRNRSTGPKKSSSESSPSVYSLRRSPDFTCPGCSRAVRSLWSSPSSQERSFHSSCCRSRTIINSVEERGFNPANKIHRQNGALAPILFPYQK